MATIEDILRGNVLDDGVVDQFIRKDDKPGLSAIPDAGGNEVLGILKPPEIPLRPLLHSVVTTDANKNAEHQKISDDLQLPRQAVDAAPQEAKHEQRTDEIANILSGSTILPVTTRLMREQLFAEVAHPDVEQLGTMERLVNAFKRGGLNQDLGRLGHKLSRQRSPETEEEINKLRLQINELGQNGDGFVSWVAGASEILGQQFNSFTTLEAAGRIGFGLGTGAAVGAAGGPLAPITVPVAALAGFTAGVSGHIMADSFEVQSGHAYLQMLEIGIDPDTASWIGFGVGAINASLEMVGATGVGKPITEGIKSTFREALQEAITTKTVQEAAKRLALAYGGSITGEVATEVTQEVVSMLGEELGKNLSEGEFEDLTGEEIKTRIKETAIFTFKAMAIHAAPGPGKNFMADVSDMRQAKRNKLVLERLNEIAKETNLKEIAPDKQAVHIGEILKEAGIDDVYIPVKALDEFVEKNGPAAASLFDELGVSRQVDDARLLNGDVRVSGENYARVIGQTEMFDQLGDHISVTPEGMTASQAAEFEENGLQEAIENFDNQSDIDAFDEATAKPNEFFTPEAIEQAAQQNDKSRDILTTISPEDFLKLAAQEEVDPVKAAKVAELVESKTQFNSVPSLRFKNNADGTGTVLGHEGRHRARALIEAGVKEMPVLLQSSEGGEGSAIRFGSQQEGSIDRLEGAFPSELIGQGNDNKVINPVQDPRIDSDDKAFRTEVVNKVTDNVSKQLGYDGLFRTARDAGWTDKQFADYLLAKERARKALNSADEKRQLKRERKANQKEQKAEVQATTNEITERVGQRPVYAAIDAIGFEQLDRATVIEMLPEGEKDLKNLPKQSKNRNIYSSKKDTGMHPDDLASLYDFESGADMLLEMLVAEPRQVVINREVEQRLAISEIRQEGTAIEQALEDLHNDKFAEVLAAELDALKRDKKSKRIKASQVKEIAREHMDEMLIKDIQPGRFIKGERAEANAASRALKKGDRDTARVSKFQQLANFQSAHLAYGVKARIAKQAKDMLRFTRKRKPVKNIPVDSLQAIRTILSDYDLGPKLSDKKRTALLDFANKKAQLEGTPIEIPQRILDADNTTNIHDMSLREWEQLYDTIKEIEKMGKDETKLRRASEAQARDEAAAAVSANIVNNLTLRDSTVETSWDAAKSFGREALLTLLNADSLVRTVDAFKEFGAAYVNLKQPYDQAMSQGYHEGQIGFTARQRKEATTLVDLFSVWSKKERLAMFKRVNIPGVRKRMSHQRVLAVLLNSGNVENKKALLNDDQFTKSELQAIYNHASEKDWKYVQSVWTYLDTLWPEIAEAIKRRKNVIPVKVQAQSIETKYGTFTGGYYPLQFSNERSINLGKGSTKAVNEARFGKFTTSHTKNGHYEERTNSSGRPVKLELFVLNSHVDQVIYDLEVGDALHDMYKVLYHKDVQKSFNDMGHHQTWEKLDLWFSDIITGEMHHSGFLEKMFRHFRTGFTVSKIGFNFTTVTFQPLGLFQSAGLIGKRNTMRGVMAAMDPTRQFGENSIWKFVSSQSAFMKQREANFNREIVEAQQFLSGSLVDRLTPGNTKEIISRAAFFGIIKLQRFVDVATWLGAKHKGMLEFNGNEAMANDFADKMVERSQATGIFGGRTQLERGTLRKGAQQTEIVRAMVPLISYFMAKTNVAYERSMKLRQNVRTNLDEGQGFKNIGEVLGWATDMALLYTVEALLVAIIRGEWPEEDEGESFPGFVANETMQAAVAGVPIIRDVLGEIEGFRGGGIYSSVLGEIKNAAIQTGQGEIDTALVKSYARLAGTALRIPGASQAIKTGEAISLSRDGFDVRFMEFVVGPRWDE